FVELLFVVYGIAALALGGVLAAALLGWIHHARRSRLAAYVARPDAPIQEGTALLRGVVDVGEDERDPSAAPAEPVLIIEAPPGAPASSWRALARAFRLKLPSGLTLRVEPEEGRWSLDTTFVSEDRPDGPVYVTQIHPGDSVYVFGSMRREIDARSAGRG